MTDNLRPSASAVSNPARAETDLRVLAMRLRGGDSQAFAELYRRESESLVRALQAYVRSRAVAEEISQDVFVQLWEQRYRINPDASIRGYLFMLGRNQAIAVLRHDKVVFRHQRRTIAEHGVTTEYSVDSLPDRALEVDEVCRLAQSRVATLSPRLQEVYFLSREQGYSPSEIALALGTSVQTVYKQLGRIALELQPVLRRWAEY